MDQKLLPPATSATVGRSALVATGIPGLYETLDWLCNTVGHWDAPAAVITFFASLAMAVVIWFVRSPIADQIQSDLLDVLQGNKAGTVIVPAGTTVVTAAPAAPAPAAVVVTAPVGTAT